MFNLNLSLIVELQNKYPSNHGFMVIPASGGADVFQFVKNDIIHRLCIREGRDLSNELGLWDRHDRSPIPKETRVKKLKSIGGRDYIRPDEEAAERRELRRHLALEDGKIPSCYEVAARSLKLDHTSEDKEHVAQITSTMNQIFSNKQQLLIDHKALKEIPALPPGVSPIDITLTAAQASGTVEPATVDIKSAIGR